MTQNAHKVITKVNRVLNRIYDVPNREQADPQIEAGTDESAAYSKLDLQQNICFSYFSILTRRPRSPGLNKFCCINVYKHLFSSSW